MNVVVIPTRDRRVDLLPPLIEDLMEGTAVPDRILIYDSSDEQDAAAYLPITDRIDITDSRYDKSLYRSWNDGWSRASVHAMLSDDPVNVAFLNDDLRVPPNLVEALSAALRSDEDVWAAYPDYRVPVASTHASGALTATFGTFRHAGMCGFCFMTKAELLGRGLTTIDENLKWWFGDDDFAFQVERAGKRIVRVDGLGIDHIGGGSAPRPGMQDQIDADKALAFEKWGA
jgi:hypothetical protein